jgi:hypothetical protein
VLFVSEKAVTRTSNNAYSLNPVKEVRQEYYYFPPSVHLITFGKIGAWIYPEHAYCINFIDS